MWAFFDFGLLMPALVPAKYAQTEAVLAWTNQGEYELQVRARLREHLQYFMDNFMEEGTFNPTIHATPDKDYNFRFYTTREAYAEGIKQAALKIDYEKFKDSSDRYEYNGKYHSILTRIWGTLCDLAQPGGIWGPRSADNPTGYDKSSRYRGWNYIYGDEGIDYSGWHDERIGSSFIRGALSDSKYNNVRFEEEPTDEELDRWWGLRDSDDGYMDYESDKDKEARQLIRNLDAAGIDYEDWMDFVDEDDWLLIQDEVRARIDRHAERLEAAREEGARIAHERRIAEDQRQYAEQRAAQKAHRKYKKSRRQGKKQYSKRGRA